MFALFPSLYYGQSGPWGDGPPPTLVYVVALQRAAPRELPPAAAPEPLQPAVHEYTWLDSGGDAASVYSVVGKDGTVRFARARLKNAAPRGLASILTVKALVPAGSRQ